MTALSCNTIPLIIVEETVEKSPYSKHHCHNCFRQLSLTDAKMQGKSMMRNRKSVSKCHLIAKNESSLTNKTLHSVSGPVILPWKTVYTHSCLVHFLNYTFKCQRQKWSIFKGEIWQTPHLPNDQTSPVIGKSESYASDMIHNITSISFGKKKKSKPWI